MDTSCISPMELMEEFGGRFGRSKLAAHALSKLEDAGETKLGIDDT